MPSVKRGVLMFLFFGHAVTPGKPPTEQCSKLSVNSLGSSAHGIWSSTNRALATCHLPLLCGPAGFQYTYNWALLRSLQRTAAPRKVPSPAHGFVVSSGCALKKHWRKLDYTVVLTWCWQSNSFVYFSIAFLRTCSSYSERVSERGFIQRLR